jgi:hypothetical protein
LAAIDGRSEKAQAVLASLTSQVTPADIAGALTVAHGQVNRGSTP